MKPLFDYLFGSQLERETARYMEALAETSVAASRRQTDALLESLSRSAEPKIKIGSTPWGAPVIVPVSEIARAHGVVTGSTGSGKTRLALKIVERLLDSIIESLIAEGRNPSGFGAFDAKGDLFHGTLFLIARRLQELQRTHPRVARELRRRIAIIALASHDPVTPYNFCVRWPRNATTARWRRISPNNSHKCRSPRCPRCCGGLTRCLPRTGFDWRWAGFRPRISVASRTKGRLSSSPHSERPLRAAFAGCCRI
jgi:hypothetical protein